MESCDIRLQLQLNARFDKAVDAVWPLLDRTSRRKFASGQNAWKRYAAGGTASTT
jgi:hypothetical protein